jgi:cardiolipin synthase
MDLGGQAGVERASAVPWRRYLPAAHIPRTGHRCELLRDGIEAYPAMLEAIEAARVSVQLETYMMHDDAVGRLFSKKLIAAVQRGVHCTVLYDWLGSWGTPRAFFRELREAGVEVRAFRPFSFGVGLLRLIRRDHRKLLVVDRQVAFVGGVNIAQHWAPKGQPPRGYSTLAGEGWRDDVLRIEGPAVAQLERSFGASWRLEAWKERFRSRARLGAGPAQPRRKGEVRLSVLSSRRAIHAAYLKAIEASRQSVIIAAAYFVPDWRIRRAIKRAARRGVEVSLVMAGKSDHQVVTWASRAFYARFLSWGVKIFEWNRGVLHAKTAVVDGTWGTLGSFNLERTSLNWNHELNVVFADSRLGARLEQTLLQDCALSQPIDREQWRLRPVWHRVLEAVAYLFRKLL